MTLKAMSRIGLLIAASLMIASPVLASDDYGRNSDRHHDRHNHRQQEGSWQSSRGPGLPSVVPVLGTFSGNIAATRIRGNGIYIAVDRSGGGSSGGSASGELKSNGVKIIHVNAATAKSACAWEAGVCVIRP